MDGDGDRFEHGSFGERERIRKPIDDASWHGDVFGEGAGAAIVGAGDAENLAVIAKIDVAATAVRAFAAVDGGVESDAIAFGKILYGFADRADVASGFVSHDDRRNAAAGGAIVTVHVATTDAAGGYANEDFVRAGSRLRQIGDFKMAVLGE